MDCKKALPMLVAVALTMLFLSACAQSTPEAATAVALNPSPTAIPPSDTPTSVPSTNTPVPLTGTPMPTNAPTSAPTATPVPPTNTPVPPTATSVPPTATRKPLPTAVPKSYTVTWKTGIEYTPRNGTSNWCQLHDEYQNNSSEDMPFQNKDTLNNYFFLGGKFGTVGGYEPIFGIANPDGSINRWALGGWYAKAFGWPNGYDEFPPPPIKAGTASGDWTFYSDTTSGQYCRYAYIKWKGQVSAAEFSGNGALVNANAALPPGAP